MAETFIPASEIAVAPTVLGHQSLGLDQRRPTAQLLDLLEVPMVNIWREKLRNLRNAYSVKTLVTVCSHLEPGIAAAPYPIVGLPACHRSSVACSSQQQCCSVSGDPLKQTNGKGATRLEGVLKLR